MDTATSDTLAAPMKQVLNQCIKKAASDIHIDPVADGALIRFRIDGHLHEEGVLPPSMGQQLMNEIRLEASIDIEHVFIPREGRFSYTYDGTTTDFRVTLIPVLNRVAMHLRVLNPPAKYTDLLHLGFSPKARDLIIKTLERPEGLILIGGPVNAGKTTTLYSIASQLDLNKIAAVSIEDPVEFNIDGVRQVDLDEKHGLTMHTGLKSILRMDPDLIMVNEIRDAHSAETAVRAASAGRFVLATIHSRDAASAVGALHYISVPYPIIASSLRVIIAQKLLRRVCPACGSSRSITAEEQKLFSSAGISAPDTVPQAEGCNKCLHTGYKGLIGIFEMVEIDPHLSKLIADGCDQRTLWTEMRNRNIPTILGEALLKVKENITTMHEVIQINWPGGTFGEQ